MIKKLAMRTNRKFIVIVGVSILYSCVNVTKNITNNDCVKPSFSDYYYFHEGLESYYEYSEGLNCAIQLNKPYLVYFTGHGCVSCREFEADVISNDEVKKLLKENFIITSLFTDDKMALPKGFQIVSEINGDTIKLHCEKSRYYQKKKFNDVTEPAFYILDKEENLLCDPYYFNLSVDSFIIFLKKGISEYSKRQ